MRAMYELGSSVKVSPVMAERGPGGTGARVEQTELHRKREKVLETGLVNKHLQTARLKM